MKQIKIGLFLLTWFTGFGGTAYSVAQENLQTFMGFVFVWCIAGFLDLVWLEGNFEA